jgi:2-polyprenyl-3-methyl-5-hydroxy-6-metoxy-1,4-benzoquinol methylase
MPLLPIAALWPTGRLIHRRRQPEWMDDPQLDAQRHQQALEALARLNRLSQTAQALWPVIQKAAANQPDRPLRVIDIACGGGDVTLALARQAQQAGLPLELSGCDLSPIAIEHAQARAAQEHRKVTFFQHDAVHDPLPGYYDLAVTSLFLHHLEEGEAITLLTMLGSRCRQVVADDLVRSSVGWLLAWSASRLITRNPVVHVDAPRSVEGAFTPEELHQLADHAGLNGARLHRHWPARMQLSWSAA